jgi:hypothetical protein
MRCEDCPRFDEDEGVCKDGKCNPQSYPAAVEVIQIHGPRAICMLNDFREQMLDIWEGKKLPGKPPRITKRGRPY